MKALKIILYMVIIIIAVLLIGVLYLTLSEYKPQDTEQAKKIKEIKNHKEIKLNDELSVLTYNLGYCNDSADSDFFMDGGKRTRIESKDKVIRNMKGIEQNIKNNKSDVVFLQEVDEKSKRAYGVNEVKYLSDNLNGSNYFAKNFSCKYIPYPFPDMIGGVEAGIVTVSPYKVSDAKRYSLPVAFKYPIRVCQMKRCLLVERVKIKNSDKELVLVNLHMEAYDDGEGKKKQTKVLTDFLNKEYKKGNYCIAGGDFNQNFPNADNKKYPIINDKYFTPGTLNLDAFSKDWTFAVDDSLPTSRLLNEEYDENSKNTQLYVIDGFILSPNVKLKKVKTIDTKFNYSDHNPVRIEVKLEKEK